MAALTPYSEDGYPLRLILQHRNSRSGVTVYIIVLLSLLLTLVSLPFIYIDISVRGKGVFHTSLAYTDLNAPLNGRVVKMQMRDNQKVLKGDTLMVIDTSLSGKQIAILNERYGRLAQFLKDIEASVRRSSSMESDSTVFLTPKYASLWHQFTMELREKKTSVDQALSMLDRYRYLYENKAVTRAEYENFKYGYDHALAGFEILKQRYRSQWETERVNYTRELKELRTAILEEEQKRMLLTIISPINGSVLDLAGIQEGSYLMAGARIARISPDTRMFAYCYIRPGDIGLIRQGQKVNFQVDAFSYNRWGAVSGTVLEIPKDVVLLNDTEPMFRVKCRLDKAYLKIGKGAVYSLKKGMTFSARFSITERSLFQLLYDSAEDWIDPEMNLTIT